MSYGILKYGMGIYKGIDPGVGHIGAFYFGPVDETISADTIEVSAILLQPDVSVINNISVTINSLYIPVYIELLQPANLYATQYINIIFVWVPRRGFSPLTVDFTATVIFSKEIIGIYEVDEYQWCFDYDYVNDTCRIPWETSTTNTISHVYTGYRGQKFTVKCCAKLRRKG